MPLDTYQALYQGVLLPFALGLPRTLAMLLVFPLLPVSIFPGLLRNGIAISLLIVTLPMTQTQLDQAPQTAMMWIVLIAKEILIGGAIGLVFALLIWAIEGVGALIDIQTGSNNGAIFDPINNQSGGPWAPFMRNLALTMFLVFGGLLIMLETLYRSFVEWPITSFYPTSLAALGDWSNNRLKDLLVSTVSLASPVIGVLLVVELGIGLINRAVPQLNVFTFAMPIKGAVAIVAVLLTLSYQFDIARSRFLDGASQWRSVRSLFAPTAGAPASPAAPAASEQVPKR